MSPRAGALARIALTSLLPLTPLTARADDGKALGTFLLQIGETRVGSVRATELAERPGAPNLVVSSAEITPALGAIVDGFAAGKALRSSVRLSTGAVAKKAEGARLASVKLPAMGAGGALDLELGFLAPSITTQPVLSLARASARSPSGGRITGFRVALDGLPAGSASKLDAITIVHRPDGAVTTSAIGFEVTAGGAPPFSKWLEKPTARGMHVEYVGADGSALLKIQLDRCAPSSVTPMGASATTRVSVRCAAVRPG
ncbi:MAG: hypothetical protein KF819_06935 [Labilithrix sp.]|nr:hypothetical protein [Labilithrix sp.]